MDWLDHDRLGFNYRLTDIACALGLAQLAKLDRFVAERRLIAADYRAALARHFPSGGVTAPAELPDRESAYHLFAVAIDWARFGTTRARVMQALADAGIGTQVHYIPLLDHPLHAQRCPDERGRPRPGAATYYARTLSLPMFPSLATADLQRVVAQLHHALGAP
jgi:dTDP-4-amino-4,6-dideoxygalactose transaminase